MNDSPTKPPVHWTEDRVERLLLKVFGDPPGTASSDATARRHSPWSHWALVATCAGLLAMLTPALMVSQRTDSVADRGEESAVSNDDELIVADVSTTDDTESDDETDGL